MVEFIDSIRNELFDEFINLLDFISLGSINLYDKITENLIVTIRTNLRKPRRGDKFLV